MGECRYQEPRATVIRTIALRVLWAVMMFGGLALLLRGLLARIYFEPTRAALAEAQWGAGAVAIACCLLAAAAACAHLVAGWPAWVVAGALTPVVLCGGLTWIAPETLFSQLAVLVAYPPALTAAVAGLVLRRGDPHGAATRRDDRPAVR